MSYYVWLKMLKQIVSTRLMGNRWLLVGSNDLQGVQNMKMIKTIVATIAMVAATTTVVQARDSISIGVNIGGHGYPTHSIGTHRHAPAFYGYYGAPTVYYSARPVVYYASPVRYNYYQPYRYYGRDIGRHGDRHHNRHHDRHSDDHRGRR
jgi:hypothetical protein